MAGSAFALALCALSALLTTSPRAQQGGQAVLSDPYAITFDAIHDAETQLWSSITQLRFAATRDQTTGAGDWVGIVENLTIGPPATAGSPDAKPRFDLTYGGGLGLNPEREALQSLVHSKHRAYLQNYAGFRVHDPVIAAQNYSIQFMVATQAIGRPIFRVAVLSNDPTANIWVLDLDVETAYPLCRTEYTPVGEIVSMLAVINFDHGPPVQATNQSKDDWWSAPNIVTHANPGAARASMSSGGIRLPAVNPTGFALHRSSVIHDPLTGDETLALEYTDGIRNITMLETAGVPLATLPTPPRTAGAGRPDKHLYAIFEFTDLSSRQLMFQVGDVRYLVLGGAEQAVVDVFTEQLLRDHVR